MAGKRERVCDNFQPGDVAIVNPHVEAKPGDYVIVKNDEDEATFKQLKKFGDTLVLHPLNSRYKELKKQGKVISLGQGRFARWRKVK